MAGGVKFSWIRSVKSDINKTTYFSFSCLWHHHKINDAI